MADIIRLLPDNVANQIAAGEVVQRPASVVKELLENSVDAGAQNIELLVKESGKVSITVIDDGKGMSPTDARMAFERHATSKISKAEDIFGIFTKGFRGEALASIAAVAQVELKTRREEDELGTLIKINGGKVASQEPCSCAVGTQIKVYNLFYNIPARRNFLKSDNVELRHIIDDFQRVALPHPSVSFHFEHNGSELFHLEATGSRQRIVAIMGKRYNEKLVPVEEHTEIIRISGFIGKPESARKTRGEQFFFVNNRFIKNAYLHKAVQMAFEGLLSEGNHPSYFLFLELDPARIDINIHPTKTEIKFEDERAIHSIIRSAIKHSLGQYNIAPSLDFDREPTPYFSPTKESPEAPPIYVNPHFNPFDKNQGGAGPRAGGAYQKPRSQDSLAWESLLNNIPEAPANERQSQLPLETEPSQRKVLNVGHKYWLSTQGEDLLLIHQRRAHERIIFEQIREALKNQQIPSQQLLFPQSLSFSAADAELLEELLPILRELGFDIDLLGKRELAVQGVPLYLDTSDLKSVLDALLEAYQNFSDRIKEDQQAIMAQQMAKVAAMARGTIVEERAVGKMVSELFACEHPYHSPEGKPVIIKMGLDEIDKSFY